MRWNGWTVIALALALAGCGARSSLEVGSGSGSGGPVQAAHMFQVCNSPTDDKSIELVVDSRETCQPPATPGPLPGSLFFFMWSQDLAMLQAGSVLAVDGNAGLSCYTSRFAHFVGGSLVFTTVVPQQGTTGTFDVTAMDGTVKRSGFEAVWCTGEVPLCWR
jgi:hypothetical protein